MPPNRYSLGLVGLGVMGRNLALNLCEHGIPVLGLDRDPEKAFGGRRWPKACVPSPQPPLSGTISKWEKG